MRLCIRDTLSIIASKYNMRNGEIDPPTIECSADTMFESDTEVILVYIKYRVTMGVIDVAVEDREKYIGAKSMKSIIIANEKPDTFMRNLAESNKIEIYRAKKIGKWVK